MSNLPDELTNQILCGDCVKLMAELLPDECVDLIIADPPFHVTLTQQTKKTPAYDQLKELDWVSDFEWLVEASRVLRDGGTIYVFSSDDDISLLKKAVREVGLRVYQRLHWIKTNPLPSYTKRNYRGGVELAYFICKGKTPAYFAERTQQELLSYWFLPIVGGKERTEHPTQKPIELMMTWIDNSCPPSGLVLDPFIGSGTTAVAAKQLGRLYLGIDISPEYVELARRRVETANPPLFVL